MKIQVHTIKEACELMKIGTTKLYQEINAGRLEAKKFGRKTLILDSSIRKWLNDLPDFTPGSREDSFK